MGGIFCCRCYYCCCCPRRHDASMIYFLFYFFNYVRTGGWRVASLFTNNLLPYKLELPIVTNRSFGACRGGVG